MRTYRIERARKDVCEDSTGGPGVAIGARGELVPWRAVRGALLSNSAALGLNSVASGILVWGAHCGILILIATEICGAGVEEPVSGVGIYVAQDRRVWLNTRSPIGVEQPTLSPRHLIRAVEFA